MHLVPLALEDDNNSQIFLGANMTPENNNYAESLADRIDDQVCKIINYCEQKSVEIIIDNRVIIDLIVEKLLDTETMEGTEFRELLSIYTTFPDKKIPYVSKFS